TLEAAKYVMLLTSLPPDTFPTTAVLAIYRFRWQIELAFKRMSNCHVVAGRSLIHLVASRLALRAPGLRAATALTRPNGSARGLACGRHVVPTGKAVGPNDVVANHRVECRDHLAHDGHDCDLRQFAGGSQTIVESFERRIPITGAHRRHVEYMSD